MFKNVGINIKVRFQLFVAECGLRIRIWIQDPNPKLFENAKYGSGSAHIKYG
jgi:hypothetical protein